MQVEAKFDGRRTKIDPPARRILLFGANGQVGWELTRSLRPLGDVVATVRDPAGSGPAGALGLDLRDLEAIRRVVREVRPAVIVNAGAHTAVDRAESEPELAERLNAEAPGVMAEEAARLEIPLVHYSTDYVFDGSGEVPWREGDPTGPLGVYGRTKLSGERAIAATGAAHLIFRTSWVYGIHGQNFVKTMLRLGSSRTLLNVVDDQVGAPTSARVIADTTAQVLAQNPLDWLALIGPRSGAYHLACGGETTWRRFAQEVFALGRRHDLPLVVQEVRPIATADYPTPAKRPLNSRLDTSRLAATFGLRAVPWRTALADTFPLLAGYHPAAATVAAA